MKKISNELMTKIQNVKLVVTDVDGVLTDGGLYYTSEGLKMKKFNVKDGMGVVLLRKNEIKCGIISTDTSDIIKKRAERLKMDFAEVGIWDKDEKLLELCDQFNIETENVAFIGDDVNDIGIIQKVGVSFAPDDALLEIKEIVDVVLSKKGGEGVFREMVQLILS